MEKLEDKTEKESRERWKIKAPCPDWKKRVEIDIAVAMVTYSPGNGLEYID
jgi:hypothetical protein